jgi:hypothetical protein
MPAQTAIQSTTQQFLDIYDIVNDLLLMKDGAVSLILTVNAINFGLFAEEEQDAVMYAYAGLLNSLNYPIQIVIRSQTKDVTSYLRLLEEQEENTTNQVQKDRIRKYRDFVSNLIHEGNVLDKKFYVVIPANALEMGLMPPQTVIPGVKKTDVATVERSVILEKAKSILEPKRDHLISQFARIGLAARQLTTQEIIQLFYTSYNPEAIEGQQITDTSSYTTPVVNAQVQAGLFSTLQSATLTTNSSNSEETTMTDTTQMPPMTNPASAAPNIVSPIQASPMASPMAENAATPAPMTSGAPAMTLPTTTPAAAPAANPMSIPATQPAPVNLDLPMAETPMTQPATPVANPVSSTPPANPATPAPAATPMPAAVEPMTITVPPTDSTASSATTTPAAAPSVTPPATSTPEPADADAPPAPNLPPIAEL